MEMERINENTIRVLIENEDLIERGITFLDLLGNQRQIENFFHSILEEVDVEDQFQETDAVTFQVLPNRNGLELFISKNIAINDSMDFEGMGINMDENVSDFMKKQFVKDRFKDGTQPEDPGETWDSLLEFPEVVIKFQSFEDFIQLAQACELEEATTTLYRLRGQYYLHVQFFEEENQAMMENQVAQFCEYGQRTSITPALLDEYGKVIMEHSALHIAKYYFK